MLRSLLGSSALCLNWGPPRGGGGGACSFSFFAALDALDLARVRRSSRRLGGLLGLLGVEAGEDGLRLLEEEGAQHQGDDQEENDGTERGTDSHAGDLAVGEAVARGGHGGAAGGGRRRR